MEVGMPLFRTVLVFVLVPLIAAGIIEGVITATRRSKLSTRRLLLILVIVAYASWWIIGRVCGGTGVQCYPPDEGILWALGRG
jgi:hypothetical protein